MSQRDQALMRLTNTETKRTTKTGNTENLFLKQTVETRKTFDPAGIRTIGLPIPNHIHCPLALSGPSSCNAATTFILAASFISE